jgi:hypothetical protein
MKQLLLFFLTIVSLSSLKAQDDISFQLIAPQGNNLNIDESIRAIITNNEGPLEVYLRGFVNEAEDGIVFEGSSSVITLPEKTSNINRRNLGNLKPFNTRFSSNDYEDYVTRTSEFPPGKYEVCVQIILASEERVIAESCYEKVIEEFLPPSLISPENKSLVTESHPFFSWSPVPGNTGNITYALLITEMVGNQSPIAAFESNPLWFKEDNIRSPLFQYPVSARKLKNKHPYAWKVLAYNGDNKVAESEVWSFIYKPDDSGADDEEEESDGESDEEVLIPEQYVSLNDRQTSGHYLIEDFILRFAYRNKYATSNLECNLINRANEVIARDILKEKQKPGLNFNELDMTNRVQPGKTYQLQCNDAIGTKKQLRFKVKKESSGNILDGIELDGGQFDGLPDNILEGGG